MKTALILTGSACLLIGALGAAWLQEHRLQELRHSDREKFIQAMGSDLLIVHEALRLAVSDPMTRALFGAQAVKNIAERERATREKKP